MGKTVKSRTVAKPAQKNTQKPSPKQGTANNKTGIVSVTIKRHADRNGGHPHVILENIEDKHVSVGFTSSAKKGKNATNYKCELNPLGGSNNSYIRRQGTVAPQKEYGNATTGKMTQKDYGQAKQYGEKAKQKYFEKEHKKK